MVTYTDKLAVRIVEELDRLGRGEPYKVRDWVYRHYQRAWYIRGDRFRLDSTGKFWDLEVDPCAPKPAGAGPEATKTRKRLAAAVAELHGTSDRWEPSLRSGTPGIAVGDPP